MIKKIQPVVEKFNLRLKLQATSAKPQAASFKKIQPVVVWISKRKI
jgi:hypothetical protein